MEIGTTDCEVALRHLNTGNISAQKIGGRRVGFLLLLSMLSVAEAPGLAQTKWKGRVKKVIRYFLVACERNGREPTAILHIARGCPPPKKTLF